jgi:hypothetical protein
MGRTLEEMVAPSLSHELKLKQAERRLSSKDANYIMNYLKK